MVTLTNANDDDNVNDGIDDNDTNYDDKSNNDNNIKKRGQGAPTLQCIRKR